jgi:ESCRT-II complex subunit VPS25
MSVFRQQPHPGTNATVTEQWITLILTYARHRKLFVLRVEDAETTDSEWLEVLRNERINRVSAIPSLFSQN